MTREDLESISDELNEFERDILYVLGHMEKLRANGFISSTEPTGHITEEGMKLFRVLEKRGHAPTPERIAAVVACYRLMDAGEALPHDHNGEAPS